MIDNDPELADARRPGRLELWFSRLCCRLGLHAPRVIADGFQTCPLCGNKKPIR